jgi:hypothetical protein
MATTYVKKLQMKMVGSEVTLEESYNNNLVYIVDVNSGDTRATKKTIIIEYTECITEPSEHKYNNYYAIVLSFTDYSTSIHKYLLKSDIENRSIWSCSRIDCDYNMSTVANIAGANIVDEVLNIINESKIMLCVPVLPGYKLTDNRDSLDVIMVHEIASDDPLNYVRMEYLAFHHKHKDNVYNINENDKLIKLIETIPLAIVLNILCDIKVDETTKKKYIYDHIIAKLLC